MQNFNVLTRRGFLDRSFKTGLAVGLSTLLDVPPILKRALAGGDMSAIGRNGKKVLFIWLRFGNDALNSIIPIRDTAYNTTNRPSLRIPDTGISGDYTAVGDAHFQNSGANSTFGDFPYAIPLGNGFAAMHPSLKFLAPVYNAGDLALVHRVGYPRQSRSHFDSQIYWENGVPRNDLVRDGILYRTIYESNLAATNPISAVSIASSLPLILRGSALALTNLSDPTRYSLLGVPYDAAGATKASAALASANAAAFPAKKNRELLDLQYRNLANTLEVFGDIDFSETGNTFQDSAKTDGDATWSPIDASGNAIPGSNSSKGYFLFPTTNDKNGGWRRGAGNNTNANKYVVDTAAYNATGTGFFNSLKAAALILNKTDAVIAGCEMSGVNIDTHAAQGALAGSHPNLQRRIGWAMYALREYFSSYGRGANPPGVSGPKCNWDDIVVVTLSEFGRTTIENADLGTDHAEAGVVFVAGGAVKGYVPGTMGNPPVRSGVYECSDTTTVPGQKPSQIAWQPGQNGAMFGVEGRYLRRTTDYRSILGEIIREHLAATPDELSRIIPGYANEGLEHLLNGGTVSAPIEKAGIDTPIRGELDIL